MKNLLLTILLSLGFIFSGCGSSSDGEATASAQNNAPVITESLVSKAIVENTSFSYDITSNITDSDGDALSVTSLIMSDGSLLPSTISLNENNLTITNNISVDDGQNLVYDLNATVSDGVDEVTYSIKLVIHNSINDSMITASFTSVDSSIINGNDSEVFMSIIDADGIESVSYDIYFSTDTNYDNSLDSGILLFTNNDIYSTTINSSGLTNGDYVLVVEAIGYIGGENPVSNITKIYNFNVYTPVVAPPPVISEPTISIADQTINDNDGAVPTDLPAPTVTNIEASAVYSMVSDPTGGKLTINSSTGIMTWSGDITAPVDYSITVKVTNTDTGNSSDTFNLHVNNQ